MPHPVQVILPQRGQVAGLHMEHSFDVAGNPRQPYRPAMRPSYTPEGIAAAVPRVALITVVLVMGPRDAVRRHRQAGRDGVKGDERAPPAAWRPAGSWRRPSDACLDSEPFVVAVRAGSLTVHAYALCILVGIFVAVGTGRRRWVARGGRADDVDAVAVWAVPFGILGGRLYHVVTDPELYLGHGRNPWEALAVWRGGLGIWGAVAVGALAPGGWPANARPTCAAPTPRPQSPLTS